MPYQVAVILSPSLYTKTGQSDLVWGIGSPNPVEKWRQTLFLLLGVPQEEQAI